MIMLSVILSLSGQGTNSFGQTSGQSGDTLQADSSRADSLSVDSLSASVDSLLADTLKAVETDSMRYSADSVFYRVQREQIKLDGHARIDYKTSNIQADSIRIDMKKDQASTHGQTWLRDRDYILIGDDVYYDFDSQTGIIVRGATKFDQGFFYGQEIRKVDRNVYDMDGGNFTTCDAREPHYYIYSQKMRLYKDDKVVARPVVFMVNHFPVMALPYGTFSIKRGRKSGILMPEPGYNSTDGKYVQNLAYFQTLGDMADATIIFDFMEKTGWNARVEGEYKKRYVLDGDFTARLQKRIYSADRTDYEWYLQADHHQNIGYASKFDADLEFLSSKRIWESSVDTDERLSERITSKLAYQNPLFGRTLYSSTTYSEDLLNDTRSITLPSVSWSLPVKPVYETVLGDSAQAKAKAGDYWWKGFTYSYKFQGVHVGDINDPHPDLSSVLYDSEQDSTGAYLSEHHAGIRHYGSIAYSHKYMGWLNISETMSGNEAWFDRDRDDKKLQRGNDWRASTSASFSLYGIRTFDRFINAGIRHIVTPRASFTYKPSFKDNDRFYSLSGVSLDSSKQSRSLAFGVDQTWQIKYLLGDKEHKLDDFFKWSSNVSFDLEKEGRRFSNLSHTFTLNPGSLEGKFGAISLNESANMTQSSYNFDVQNWHLSSTIGIHGNARYRDYFPEEPNRFQSNRFFTEEDTVKSTEPLSIAQLEKQQLNSQEWSLSLSHDYSKTRDTDRYTSNLRGTFSLQLTKNWQLSYSDYYNLYDHELVSQSLTVNRDMHCWKLTFSWTKSGDYWNYRLNFYDVKLPDALRFRTSNHKN
jgi:lipopolysaccharide assembly outer membrane protein LptD (OstA)